ncbi:TPR repeat-containing protein [Planctopirus limnophila DSM 3776]|jgi:Flp pilus assembly protein TadD|uniref:TPR repeat-containing protein n=2 Tax=Planctopirus TaxID=1649480 RepID=D5SNT6_PLAL2|nr:MULTISPECIES: bacterial transcriptional activator domain-containing protein [Planctopirus]ADG66091.1 TPR repeat-containing protein [Planctopirus limnophila DSM 3776]ODA34845.1 hypothetical protein A6X21_04100 [Planctopirus hydrillae]
MAAVDDAYDAAIRLKNQGDLDGAAKSLEAILVEYPEHVLTYSALAVILQKLGRHDEAIAHARKVTELEPHDSFSYTQMSVICQRCGRIAEAEEALARMRMMQASGMH